MLRLFNFTFVDMIIEKSVLELSASQLMGIM